MEERGKEAEVLLDGKKLRHLRMARELTQGQLEVKSGIGQGHISKLETGKRTNIEIATAWKLAQALDVRISDLLVEGAPMLTSAAAQSILLSEQDIRDAVARALGGQSWLSEHALERIAEELWRKEMQRLAPPSAQPNAE